MYPWNGVSSWGSVCTVGVHIWGCVCGIVCPGAVAGGDGCGAGGWCERLRVGRGQRGGRGQSIPACGALCPPPAGAVRSSRVPGDSWHPKELARASGAAWASPPGGPVRAAHVGGRWAPARVGDRLGGHLLPPH